MVIRGRSSKWTLWHAILVMLLGCLPLVGQPDEVELAPPPLRVLEKGHKELLDREKDIGSRTKLSLKLMEGNLVKAEGHSSKQSFDDMLRELGHFLALMDDSLDYLSRNNKGSGKVLDNFKRLEIGLRKFIPRLEVVRRDLPLRYEDYVRRLMIRIREARSKATDPLFGDSVLRDGTKPI